MGRQIPADRAAAPLDTARAEAADHAALAGTALSDIVVTDSAHGAADHAMGDGTPSAPLLAQSTAAAAGPVPGRHSVIDDAQGIAFGAAMAAFAAFLLGSAGLITGQLAGLALLVSEATGWRFGPVYLLLSLPFYGFGYRRLGLGFLLRTVAAVLLMVAVSMALPQLIQFDRLHPGAAAVLSGLVTGAGLLALFRHRASLGGIGAVALDIQDRTGIRAGWVQMGFDAALFAAALAILPLALVLWSALGAAVVNLTIAINHRRDRYVA